MEKKEKFTYLIMGIVFCVIMIFAISQKENYHVDEIFNYGLANHHSNGFASMKIKKGKIYSNPLKPYDKYMTVDKKHRFDYKSVWENQKVDVHPPLYYALLHTVCSFFPGRFSKWFAGILNIGFAILALFMVRKIVLYLTGDKTGALLASMGFVLNSGIISSTTFLRMYVMAMFWGCVLVYLFLKLYREGVSKKLFILLYITTVLAALTHYYCIVYIVLLSLVLGILLLVKKEWKSCIQFCLLMMAAAGTAILIFPSMMKHLFFGYRGEEAIQNLKSGQGYLDRIKAFFGYINIQLFGSQLAIILLVMLLVVLCVSMQKENKHINISYVGEYLLLFIPLVLYFVLVSKMAAFTVDRYLFPIYGAAYAAVFCGCWNVLSRCFAEKQKVLFMSILLALVIQGSWNQIGWPYLYKGTDEIINTIKEEYADTDCVFIYSERFRAQYKYREVGCYNTVTFVKDDDLLLLPEYKEPCTGLIVIINSPESHTAFLNQVLENYPTLTQYKEIVGAGEGKTYYCW